MPKQEILYSINARWCPRELFNQFAARAQQDDGSIKAGLLRALRWYVDRPAESSSPNQRESSDHDDTRQP